MSRTDLRPAPDTARGAKTFHDSDTLAIREALALLPALYREADHDLQRWHFLSHAPQFCVAMMLGGAVIWAVSDSALGTGFLWTSAILTGIVAVTSNHIRGFAKSPRQMPLADVVRELRLLLLYLGLAWGAGAFLVLPQKPALAFVFAVLPVLVAILILKDKKGAAAFGSPVMLLTAGTVLWGGWMHAAWTGAAILIAGASIAAPSMLQCAILWRRTPY
jgi:hypothetical protein